MPLNEPLSDQVFHQLLTLMRIHRQYSRHINDEQGITPREISVLRFLSENDTVQVNQIQNYIHHSPSTTSTLIDKLEDAGYIARTRSQTDRRVVLVTLTAQGHGLLATTPLGGMPLLRRELETMPQERLTTMFDVLTEIQSLMQSAENS